MQNPKKRSKKQTEIQSPQKDELKASDWDR